MSTRHRNFWLVLVVVVIMMMGLLLSCSESKDACLSKADCKNGFDCVDGECVEKEEEIAEHCVENDLLCIEDEIWKCINGVQKFYIDCGSFSLCCYSGKCSDCEVPDFQNDSGASDENDNDYDDEDYDYEAEDYDYETEDYDYETEDYDYEAEDYDYEAEDYDHDDSEKSDFDGVETILIEDFEEYEKNTFPASKWILKWNGAGTSHQTVTDEKSFGGYQSMQLQGKGGWSAVMYSVLNGAPEVVFFEVYVMPEGDDISVSFCNLDEGVWGAYLASVGFSQGKINYKSGASDRVDLFNEYLLNVWYKIKMKYDLTNTTVSVWINDSIRVEDVEFIPSEVPYKHFCLSSGHAGNRGFFDEIKIWSE